MKRTIHIIFLFISLSLLILSSCKDSVQSEKSEIQDTLKENQNESKLLLSFFEKSGNFINQPQIPTMVSVDDVFENLHSYHVIDLRDNDSYASGHIEGAVNVEWDNLLEYLKNDIAASNYEKIVFVCYTNQSASYAAMMFRLLGYGNVYSMKYGMSACDKATAEAKWQKNISSKYSSGLETKSNPKNIKSKYPILETGESTGYSILEARVNLLLKKRKFSVKVDEVFANPRNYYIVNYWPEEHYKKGHIPGAIQYEPKKSLIPQTQLLTLPQNKPIVVYCYTGQHAAFVTAYLQILGYDAYTLLYGANGFMHNKLISEGIGHAYDKNVHFTSYPLIKGELPSLKTVNTNIKNTANSKEDNTPVVPIIKKKKEASGGC